MKTEKGNRKLAVNRETGCFLLVGLIVALVCAGFFKIDASVCVQAFALFVAGLVGKDSAFIYGNAKEHQAAPKPPQ